MAAVAGVGHFQWPHNQGLLLPALLWAEPKCCFLITDHREGETCRRVHAEPSVPIKAEQEAGAGASAVTRQTPHAKAAAVPAWDQNVGIFSL